MKQAFEIHKIIKSKRQEKSLKTFLTSAKLPSVIATPIVKKFGRPNCGTCINLNEEAAHKFKSVQILTAKSNSTYSRNFIYAIKCQECNEDYIGEIKLALRNRLTIRRQQIQDPSTKQVP